MKAAIFFCLTTLIVTASPVLALVTLDRPQAGDLALVVGSPFGASLAQILANSETTDAYPGRAPFGVFVVLENAQTASSLKEAGAVLVLSGKEILALC